MTAHYGGDGSHFTSEPDDFVGELFAMSEAEFEAWVKEVHLDDWEVYSEGEDDRIEFPFTKPNFLDSAELDAWLNCGRGADLHFEDWIDHGGEA